MQSLRLISFVIKRPLFWLYGGFLIWVLLIFWGRLYPSPFFITLTFLLLIFLPGFSLSRLFKISYADDKLGNIILWLTTGLIFNLGLAFLAMLIGLNITQLVGLCLVLDGLLLTAAFVLDILRPANHTYEVLFGFRNLFKAENLIYFFLGLFILLVLITIDQLGGNYLADPYYHLAIIRKAVEGQALSPANLSYLKDQFHPAYTFPSWHVFLGLGSKLSATNIFTFWNEILMALSILVFLVWYWLFLKILPNRFLAVLGLFLFIIYYFGPNAYIFTRLPVPDTISQLMFLPLTLALALKYIFPSKDLGTSSQASRWKHLIILSLLLFLMTKIHMVQYFYFLTVMAVFALVYLVFQFKAENFQKTLLKILAVIFANFILVVPYLILLQLKSQTLSEHLDIFAEMSPKLYNDQFVEFNIFLKLAFILLPFLLLFWHKYRKLLFFFGLYLSGPLIMNFPGLKSFLLKTLSQVYIKRFYLNTGWAFVIWALVLGFVLVLVDRLILRLKNGFVRYLVDFSLALILILAFVFESQWGTMTYLYSRTFSEVNNLWLAENFSWIVIIIASIVFGLFLSGLLEPKFKDVFAFEPPKNQLAILLITLTFLFFLSNPGQGHLRTFLLQEFQDKHTFAAVSDPTSEIVNFQKFGGQETIDYIQKNLPPKVVFDTNSNANYTLPTIVDVHMASYTFEKYPTRKYRDLYKFSVPLDEKLEKLRESKIDYLLFTYEPGQESSPFEAYPEYFEEVYDNTKAALYRVNREKIELDSS